MRPVEHGATKLYETPSPIAIDNCKMNIDNDAICAGKKEKALCALNSNCIYDNSRDNVKRLTSICSKEGHWHIWLGLWTLSNLKIILNHL